MSLRDSAPAQPLTRLVFGLGIWLLSSWPAAANEAVGITWRTDLGQAQQEAVTKDRPLWIQLTGSWCSYCHLMERETFVHDQVVTHSRDSFVPVKLQADQHEYLTSRLGITSLPASIIVSPTGTILSSHQGFLNSQEFVGFQERALAQYPPHVPQSKPVVANDPEPESAPEVAVTREAAEVGLSGFCPVSLVRGQTLVLGDDALTLEHGGRSYRFADDVRRAEFLRRPERYAPVNAGQCPVSQVDEGELKAGDPRFGILFGGHLYLCADDEHRTQFLRAPRRYARVNLAEKDFCPHCWGPGILQNPTGIWLTNLGSRKVRPGSPTSEVADSTAATNSLVR